jgi:hypothetical protein
LTGFSGAWRRWGRGSRTLASLRASTPSEPAMSTASCSSSSPPRTLSHTASMYHLCVDVLLLTRAVFCTASADPRSRRLAQGEVEAGVPLAQFSRACAYGWQSQTQTAAPASIIRAPLGKPSPLAKSTSNSDVCSVAPLCCVHQTGRRGHPSAAPDIVTPGCRRCVWLVKPCFLLFSFHVVLV